MSKMTSSTAVVDEESIRTNEKVLTDFSIESIIGTNHQQHSNNNSINRRDATKSRTTIKNDQFNSNSSQPAVVTNRKYRPKNFQCPACKMAFSNNGQLKNHVRIHTGERPFRCNQPDCNKTFTRNEELTRHKLIHTGVRPHSCPTCGKRFGRKDHLKKHVRTHDRKKLRKKVFVPTNRRNSYITAEDVFVPPKPVRLNTDNTNLITIAQTKIATATTTTSHNNFAMAATNQLIPATSSLTHPPPVSSINHCLYHPSALATTAAITATTLAAQQTTTATSAIQQLASDYWNKWYNLLGLYQHQHYPPPIDRLSDLFRK